MIPCPHFNIEIVKRSDNRSAVAASAYLSGTRLCSDYNRRYHDYAHKKGIVHAEVLLPERAPPEYADRAALWNSVESAEKQWNSQLARRIIVALPKELSREDNIRFVRQYCQEQFVDKGMCCDFAVHDEGCGNPHAYILLTMRPLDKRGKWLPKARKVYDLDEHGQRIRLSSCNWKSHKENTVDWNDQSKAELWRHEWEVLQNRFLESAGREERVDLRSFERQGSDFAPTVHMGPAVTHMERKGIPTDIGDLNREIRSFNRIVQSVKDRIRFLLDSIAALVDAAQQEQDLNMVSLVNRYYETRDCERQQWQASGKTKLQASAKDFARIQQTIDFLQSHHITEIADFRAFLARLSKDSINLKHNHSLRTKKIAQLHRLIVYCENQEVCDDTYRKYQRIFFKKSKEKYYQEHKKTIDCYVKAQKAMRDYGIRDAQSARSLMEKLKRENADTEDKLKRIQDLLKKCKSILKMANAALPEEMEQISYEPAVPQNTHELLPEPRFAQPHKPSIQQRLRDAQTKERTHTYEERITERKHEPSL